ncbi:uncharacterized protein LOC128743375 [Sabethes cyaneus]|uniref:uncharacterized protein LOC128743375 n=1 Tax=Sabethes cyaneus TaxID=53552 RepID=UPI00237DAD69|nr:uncharacterized protein LOC128743375 [Sabethes cyaneus]
METEDRDEECSIEEIEFLLDEDTSISDETGPTEAYETLPVGKKRKKEAISRVPDEVDKSSPVKLVQEPAERLRKAEWTKIVSPALKATLKRSFTKSESCESSSVHSFTDSDDDMIEDGLNKPNYYTNEQLNRIETKLDNILLILSQHESVLKKVKHNVKLLEDARIKSKFETPKEDTKEKQIKKHRTNLITFPVPDDDYFLRIEELVQGDEEVREDLVELYNKVASDNVYEWMRKNTYALFTHTSKYTWTGKVSNRDLSGAPSNPAQGLHLVDLLISTGCEKFPKISRDYMEKEFKRALGNFNDTKYIKWVKRAKIKAQTTSDTNGEGE